MGIYARTGGWLWGTKTIQGFQHRTPLGTKSRREAETAYNQWAASLAQPKKSWQKRETAFADAVNVFTEHRLPHLKKSSAIRYLQSLLILAPHFDGKTLQAIDRADLSAFVAARRKNGVADSSILRDLACLSSVFSIAADWELTDINQVAAFIRAQKRRKILKEGEHRTRYLDHREEYLILMEAVGQALAPDAIRKGEKLMIARALALYIDLGFRPQELLAMRWYWIDMGRCEVTIPADHAKAGKSRTVPLLPRAQRLLQGIPKNKHTDLVLWRTAQGRGFADLNRSFQRIAAQAGIENVHVHDLRRTCGCRLLQDHRLAMAEVSKWLGHASVTVTEKVYAFLQIDNLHDAVGTARVREDYKARLDAVLDGARAQNAGETITNSSTRESAPLKLIGNS